MPAWRNSVNALVSKTGPSGIAGSNPAAGVMIIAFKGNIASKNIGEELESRGIKVEWISEPALDVKTLPPADYYIVVYSHRSVKGVPSLTVHPTGNFHTADIGGLPETLQETSPLINAEILVRLKKFSPEGFEVTYEATHHGPTNINAPLCFVELGSTEKEWSDKKGITAVASAVEDFIKNPKTSDWKQAIGIGSTHYPERFTRRTLNDGIAFGHIIPAHAFQHLKKSVMTQAIIKTIGVTTAVIDTSRQGTKDDRKIIFEVLEENSIELVRLR